MYAYLSKSCQTKNCERPLQNFLNPYMNALIFINMPSTPGLFNPKLQYQHAFIELHFLKNPKLEGSYSQKLAEVPSPILNLKKF